LFCLLLNFYNLIEQKFINFKDLNSYLLIKFSKNLEVKELREYGDEEEEFEEEEDFEDYEEDYEEEEEY
jgi:hypothetical protein